MIQIIRSFFGIIHFLVKQNWAHSHNLRNILDLIAEYGRNEPGKTLKTLTMACMFKVIHYW